MFSEYLYTNIFFRLLIAWIKREGKICVSSGHQGSICLWEALKIFSERDLKSLESTKCIFEVRELCRNENTYPICQAKRDL